MPIPVMLDSLDDLSDEMKENYAKDEKSGKYLLQLDGLEDHPDVRGLSTANKTNRTKRDELKAENEDLQKKLEESEAKLAKASELPEGYSEERWNELLALEDTSKEKRDERLQAQKESYEKRISELTTAHDKAIATKDDEITERDTFIERTVKEGGLRQALMDNDVDTKLLGGAIAMLLPQVKITRDESGARKAVVETDLGTDTVDEFVGKWVKGDTGKHYIGKSTGPGPKDGDKKTETGKTITREAFSQLNPAEQSRKAQEGIKVVD